MVVCGFSWDDMRFLKARSKSNDGVPLNNKKCYLIRESVSSQYSSELYEDVVPLVSHSAKGLSYNELPGSDLASAMISSYSLK